MPVLLMPAPGLRGPGSGRIECWTLDGRCPSAPLRPSHKAAPGPVYRWSLQSEPRLTQIPLAERQRPSKTPLLSAANLPGLLPVTSLRSGIAGGRCPGRRNSRSWRPWSHFPATQSGPCRVIRPTNLLSGKPSPCSTGSCYHGNEIAALLRLFARKEKGRAACREST